MHRTGAVKIGGIFAVLFVAAISLSIFLSNVSAIEYSYCGGSIPCDCSLPGVPALNESRTFNASDNLNNCANGLVVDEDNVALDCNNLAIAGSGSNYGITINSDNVTVKNCIISNYSEGIYSSWVDNLTLQNNTIYNIASSAIDLYTSSGWVKVLNNNVHDAQYGIMLNAFYDGDIISGNTVNDVVYYGIYAYNITNANIANNNINNITDGYGIYAYLVSNSNFTKNNITNSYYDGIYLGDSDNNIISGGEIGDNNNGEDSSCAGINFEDGSTDNTITGVYMHNNKYGAIRLVEESDNNIIDANNIDSNCGNIRQILLDNAIGVTIQNNNITNGTGKGIEAINACGDLKVLNNNISGNAESGIYINGNSGTTNTYVFNNTFSQNGANCYPNCNGVTVYNDGNVTIESNNFTSQPNAGIYAMNADVYVINGNYINNGWDNDGYAIYDAGTPTVYWTVTEPVDCINNTVYVWGTVTGVENINAVNCQITVQDDDLFCGGEYGNYCGCGDIVMGDVLLQGNIECDGSGLIIGKDNVTFDCNEYYSIYGTSSYGVPYSYGIQIDNVSGVTVKYCDIYNFRKGINLVNSASNNNISYNYVSQGKVGINLESGSSNNIIAGNVVYDMQPPGVGLGVRMDSAPNNTVKENEIYQSPYGVKADSSNYSIVQGNTIYDVTYGAYFNNVGYGKITNNTIRGFGDTGIYLQAFLTSNNIVSGNTVYVEDSEITGIYVSDDNTDVKNNTVVCSTSSLTNGFYIDGSGYDSTFEGNEVSSCYYGIYANGVSSIAVNGDYYHDNAYGMYVSGSSTVYVEDTNFYSNYDYGIYNTYGSDVYVTNGNFIGNGWDSDGIGIYDEGPSIYWSVTEPVNCIDNSVFVLGDVSGFNLINASNCPIYVKGNEITEDDFCGGEYGECSCGDYVMDDITLTDGLSCDGDALNVGANGVIIDCAEYTISGNGISGIGIYSQASRTTVRNCVITDFGEAGIHLYRSTNNLITSNLFERNGISDNSGIGLFGVSRSQISGNEFYNNDVGIYLGEGSTGNTVQGNTVAYSEMEGVRLENSDSNTITGNDLSENGQSKSLAQIYLANSDSNTISDNDVFEGLNNGIFAYYSDGDQILGNRIINNSGDGIVLYSGGGGSNHVIDGNDINYNRGYGLYMSEEDNIIISNNNFRSNLGDGIYGLNSEAKVYNCNFYDNALINGNYAIYDESVRSIDWTVDQNISCINNNVDIYGAFSIKNGAQINAVNCTITVGGWIVDLSGGQIGYMSEFITLLPNESFGIGDQDAGIELNLTADGDGYLATVSVATYNQLPGGVSGYGLTPLGTWIVIEQTGPDTTMDSAIIKIYYTDEELAAAGLDESTLVIKYYNATDGTWESFDPPRGGVNTAENYVWANTSHFSGFGVFGSFISTAAAMPSYGSTGTAKLNISAPSAINLVQNKEQSIQVLVGTTSYMKDVTLTIDGMPCSDCYTITPAKQDVSPTGYATFTVTFNVPVVTEKTITFTAKDNIASASAESTLKVIAEAAAGCTTDADCPSGYECSNGKCTGIVTPTTPPVTEGPGQGFDTNMLIIIAGIVVVVVILVIVVWQKII